MFARICLFCVLFSVEKSPKPFLYLTPGETIEELRDSLLLLAVPRCRAAKAGQAGGAAADDGDDEGEGERREAGVREAGRAQAERDEGGRRAHGHPGSR